jgi:lipopolysaccharide/colanic/teichoic acid biosynthesis glycosyltransferase
MGKTPMKNTFDLYKNHFKRVFDIFCALLALFFFCWLYAIIAVLIRVKLGNTVIFTQLRPGKKGKDEREKLFKLYKFRTMTNERDENGKLLPDDLRLTRFGKLLRATSLDELPEVWNILKGDMSFIGPRPQLVRDMVFMTAEQRERHNVRPGLSGLAQISGRNAISWEGKLAYDLEYLKHITFFEDLRILIKTVQKVLQRDGVTEEGMATAVDFGDYLLNSGKITHEEYEKKQTLADEMLRGKNLG